MMDDSFDGLVAAERALQAERAGRERDAANTKAVDDAAAARAFRTVLVEAGEWLTSQGWKPNAVELSGDGWRSNVVRDGWFFDHKLLTPAGELFSAAFAWTPATASTMPGSDHAARRAKEADERRKRFVRQARRHGYETPVRVQGAWSASVLPPYMAYDDGPGFYLHAESGRLLWIPFRDTISPVDPASAGSAKAEVARWLAKAFT